jgi:hypothetical protein
MRKYVFTEVERRRLEAWLNGVEADMETLKIRDGETQSQQNQERWGASQPCSPAAEEGGEAHGAGEATIQYILGT